MAISFVGAGEWSEGTDDTSFTLQKPTGVQSGDFMLAILGLGLFSDSGNPATVTPPAGWTLVRDTYSSPNHQQVIMSRTAGSSEPGSWNGTLSGSRAPKASIVVAYRGVAGIAVSDDNTSGTVTSMSTGSVTNPSSTNWRLVMGSYGSATTNYSLSSNEVIERADSSFETSSSGTECGAWDSNGTIASGSTSRTMSRGAVWESGATWIAILDATDGANVDGSFSATMPKVTMSGGGTLGYSATFAVTVPVLPTMTASGIATPPAGTLEVAVLPVMSLVAATAASGTLNVVPAPIIDLRTETRQFGVRVVTPEAESRVITPRLGASD